MREPASEARYFCSRTSITCEVTRSISFDASARSLSDGRHRVGRQIDARGKTPRAVTDHTDAEADGLAFDGRLQLAIASNDGVAAKALDAEVAVRGAAPSDDIECHAGEAIEGQCEKGR